MGKSKVFVFHPMIIFSITSDCNLDCQGCYAKALHAAKNGDMSSGKLAEIIDQADQLGVSGHDAGRRRAI